MGFGKIMGFGKEKVKSTFFIKVLFKIRVKW